MQKAVFLDRDGVINDNKMPVNKPEDFIFFPWTFEAIKMLNNAGYPVFVVTNQGGIEMGHLTHEDLKNIHDQMLADFHRQNIFICDIAYCPHFQSKCECRKPAPGMLFKLAKKHHIDLKASYMVGDREVDMDAGRRAGCKTIKIGKPCKNADYTAKNLLDAAKIIISAS
ncbi:D-glycero-alpha-D-manno-heptose-1,7-bisphosphate 7-phosphatase [Thermotalea metallivorans]|uniref:D,D-heptose 1,7-bisphosphate phosphatase n=1 Tax=Thermotalea metallivorans TaxID=520762 RepID=A0A140KZ67_9FIRM|nr:HAD family hydrolase [Thermotalea metallivorans]KXG73592.1 D-glycero-alpha-D-manno-heptose-1,7-bisphosphate 7-phosphatase [Thermotalea metallivorans]